MDDYFGVVPTADTSNAYENKSKTNDLTNAVELRIVAVIIALKSV